MRPTYEKEDDRKNEREVMDYLRARYGIKKAVQMPRYHHFDYHCLWVNRLAHIEIKARPGVWSYPDIILSAAKLDRNWVDYQETEATFWFVVRDVKHYGFLMNDVRMQDLIPTIKMAGRYDRGDPKDLEPCYHIPKNYFVEL